MTNKEEKENVVKDGIDGFLGFLKERFTSPMYLYFILAWIITNWKFLFAIFMIDQNHLLVSKIDYLSSFYIWSLDSLGYSFWTLCKLVIIPAVSAGVAVWWLSKISELFFRESEGFKMKKRAIKYGIEWIEEKYKKKELRYQKEKFDKDASVRKKQITELLELDNQDKNFNRWYDESSENSSVLPGVEISPSEALSSSKVDYDSAVSEFLVQKEGLINNFIESGSYAMTHDAVSALSQFQDYLTDGEAEKIILGTNKNSQIISDPDVVELIDFIYKKHGEFISKETKEIAESFVNQG